MQTTLLCCKIERNERTEIIHGLLHPQKHVETTPYMPQFNNFKLATYQIFYFHSKYKDSAKGFIYVLGKNQGKRLKSLIQRVTLSAVKYLLCRSGSWRQWPQPCWPRKLTPRKSLAEVSIIYPAKCGQRKHFRSETSLSHISRVYICEAIKAL